MPRDDVTAAEQGYWILTLVDKKHYSMPQLMQRFRRSEAWINERVDLVQTDAEISAAVAERRISFSVAKQLLRVKEKDHRDYYLQEAVRLELSSPSLSFMIGTSTRAKDRR